MSQKLNVELTCDHCQKPIKPTGLYVMAQVYGSDFHLECTYAMSGAQMIVALGIDDVKVMAFDDWPGAIKANSYFRKEMRENRG